MEQFETIKPEKLVRYLSGECTSKEAALIDSWRNESADNELVFNEYKQIWESDYQTLLPDDVLSDDWNKIRNRINFRKEKYQIGFTRAFFKVAAVFVLMLGLSAALYTYWNVPGFGRWTAFQTGDYVDSLRLPDNSMVFLNNHSSLKYLKNFNDGKRTVSLDGEGFFDVVNRTDNPFQVKTPEGVNVEVVGTTFHLEGGRGIDNVELNVTEGVVSLKYRDFSNKVEAGNSAVMENHNFQIKPTVNSNFLSWKTGELVFSQSSLSAIANTLKDHFDRIETVRIETESEVLVTTSFKEQPISDVLEELEFHFGKKFQLKEGVLTISD